ncbi:MAG: radical SAM protein [Acidobacteriota bacterium]|nr:radical SAM protein [Acidobacteriota bacterium]
MATDPVLFPVTRPTTTRDVARQIKLGGVGALSEAQRRADQATYQEVRCRSALNKVDGMPFFRWTLNPYRGCTHACHYCFARRYHTQFELNSGDHFASVILVKTNLVDVLRRELDRPSWTRELVALGTATDPYQPIEGHYRLTRGALEALRDSATPVGIVTKGPMAVRDRDLFLDINGRSRCTVYFSVPTVDEEAWRRLEPGTAPPLQRLRAVRELVDAGVNAGVLIAPIVPGLTSQPAKLERTVKAIADHGARFVGAMVLHLEAGTRAHFMSFLQQEYPTLVPRYERLYAGKYASKPYVAEVQGVIGLLQERYGVRRGSSRTGEEEASVPGPALPPEPTQERLSFGRR